MKPYASPHLWSAERPETLVVCCSDGRYHPHIEEFVRSHVSEKPDLVAIPGGPAVIDPWASSFDGARVFEEALHLLVSSHEISSVWLIAHHGCGFYKKKYGELSEEDLRSRQLRDLKKAKEWLYERQPNLKVHVIYALVKSGRVLFVDVKDKLA